MEQKQENKKKVFIIFTVILMLLIAGGSFCGGMFFGKSQNANTRAKFAPGNFSGERELEQNFAGRGTGATGAGGGAVNGEVTGVIGNSVVVQQRDGSKKTVDISSASISKMVEGLVSDINIGTTITIVGSVDSNGSFSAKTIQIPPITTGTPGQNL